MGSIRIARTCVWFFIASKISIPFAYTDIAALLFCCIVCKFCLYSILSVLHYNQSENRTEQNIERNPAKFWNHPENTKYKSNELIRNKYTH